MAIDFRFSKDNFKIAAASVDRAREMLDQLEEEVLQILEPVVAKKMNEVVNLLNEQGHQLRSYYPEPGHIAFRDDRGIDSEYQCDLRVAADVVVSVGFRDTVDISEVEGDVE